VAWATDGAKPGDSFYGIDRALEAVGINDGGGDERVLEIKGLFDAGEIASGLNQAADVTPDISHEASFEASWEMSTALAAAAANVASNGSDTSEHTRQAVSALLAYLSGNVGQVDMPALVDLAKAIGESGGASPSVPADPPADAPGSPPAPPVTHTPPLDVPPGSPTGVPGGPPQP